MAWAKSMFVALLLSGWLLTGGALRAEDLVDLGHWKLSALEQLQHRAALLSPAGEQIAFLSTAFLDTPYIADTLIGSVGTPEKFVVRLDGVDCFTLLDYVEALRRSTDFPGFKTALRNIRYRAGRVDFLHRHHFFSDWGAHDGAALEEVTVQVGGAEKVRWVDKQLNRKADGSRYLPGYPVRKRRLAYIPPGALGTDLQGRLRSGDYIGIYSPAAGLDVSHCGILIRQGGRLYLRHASSRNRLPRVMDEDLVAYLGTGKGLIVYRPRSL